MGLTRTFLNRRIELLEGCWGPERQAELEALARLCNRTLGPVTAAVLHRPEPGDLSFYCSMCRHGSAGALLADLRVRPASASRLFVPGGGKGMGMQQALLGGIGEAAERLLAILHFRAVREKLVQATWTEMKRRGLEALGPADLPLFAPEQYGRPGFPYAPFQPDTSLGWIEGRRLLTGEPVWAPAQLVLIYYSHLPGERRIGYPTTGGLAFQVNRRRAILHGLYEFIERDAINLCWYCRLPPPQVAVDLPAFVRRCLDGRHARLATAGIDGVRVYLNTLDIPIPVLTVMAVDRSRTERAFLGGGGAWSGRDRALAQALLEIGQTRNSLKFVRPVGGKDVRPDSDLAELTEFFDATVYWGYAEKLPGLAWYADSGRAIPWEAVDDHTFRDEAEEYAAMLALLRQTGLNPVVFDFSAACPPGAVVMKVLIPQLTQACVPAHPYLGHPRFYELPRRLGLADRQLAFGDLDPGPVPFP